MIKFLRNYSSIFWLIGGIALGSLFGIFCKTQVAWIKPIGDIFLNLLFTAVIPLVFFAIASAISAVGGSEGAGRLIGVMALVFLVTVLLASVITLITLFLFPIHLDTTGAGLPEMQELPAAGDQIVRLFTVDDFLQLLSRKNMLALIVFSVLIGMSAKLAGPAGEAFRSFLHAANAVMRQLLRLIMKLAPLGLGAWFAYQVATIGPQLFGVYAHTLAIAHGVSLFYYVGMFSLYALLAGGAKTMATYWKHNIVPSITALATCSSIATIPANLEAAQKMGISERIADLVMPLGATIHKEGSAIAAVVKAVVALALVHKTLSGWEACTLVILIAVLVSIVEGGIPNGGYVGEMLIVSACHLPPEALPIMMILGTLLDPIATLLNATGDTVSGLLIQRVLKNNSLLKL